MAGGALGATPSQTGQVANTSSGLGLPMAPGTDQAIQQAQSQFQSQANSNPMQQQMQSAPPMQNPYGSQLQSGFNPFTSERMGALRQDPTFSASSDEGMFAPGSFQQQPAGLNTLTGLYSGSGGAGIDPKVQQAKQQGFGFGGAYGQQAQARMQPQQYQQQNAFQQQPQLQGLQQLLSRLMSGYQNRPQYGAQASVSPMPAYTSAASSYKPDYMRAQEALNRTATTKAEAEAAAAAAAQAKLDAQMGLSGSGDDDADFRAWQRRQYEASKYNYGG